MSARSGLAVDLAGATGIAVVLDRLGERDELLARAAEAIVEHEEPERIVRRVVAGEDVVREAERAPTARARA